MEPKSAVIAVTYKCNSRCTMCDIWQREVPAEVGADFYLRLPPSLRQVNISGGEPMLRSDLGQILENIQRTCKDVRIVISTNGLQPKRTLELLGVHPEIGVRVSVDGLEEAHDKIRDVPGNFKKCLETLDLLRAGGFKDLGFSYTVSERSDPQLLAVKRLADERRMEFTCSVAHSSNFFFGTQKEAFPRADEHVAELETLMDLHLRSGRPKEWFRAYYTNGLIRRLRGKKRMMPCYALEEFFYLDPYGNVYPCNVLDRPIGNLGDRSYADLVRAAGQTLEYVRHCPIQCWMVCTAAPAMRRDIKAPASWILRRKLLGRGGEASRRRVANG